MPKSGKRKKNRIEEQAYDLIDKVTLLSDRIATPENSNISHRLRTCLDAVPEKLNNGTHESPKSEKIKNLIRVFEALSECRDYLNLIEKLKYASTGDLIEQVDMIGKMIISENPSTVAFLNF